jgi:urease accessory protein
LKNERKTMLRKTTTALAILLAAPLALAHGEGVHTHGAGLIAGLAHPFSGLDHLLAMVAVGLWAAQQRGQALWALPSSFIAAMGLGAALGLSGVALPAIEAGIALSVLVLGLLVALQSRWGLPVACAATGMFALFHGAAHGLEMPLAASPWGYGLGMLAATALLHAAGVLAGVKTRAVWLRLAGAAVSITGIGMMLLPLGG